MNPEKEAALRWEVADFKSCHVQPWTVSYIQKNIKMKDFKKLIPVLDSA